MGSGDVSLGVAGPRTRIPRKGNGGSRVFELTFENTRVHDTLCAKNSLLSRGTMIGNLSALKPIETQFSSPSWCPAAFLTGDLLSRLEKRGGDSERVKNAAVDST